MEKFVCLHGHFYQPPRENPWLEAIELQDSAYPYHDWNERITHECYAPNAAARILDAQNRIVEIVNNYSRISFNFGPTLLAWMEKRMPEVYQAILDADKASLKIFSGHGSAMAQIYGHIIMPLANSRDKLTQVIWGIRDFEHRFGRRPEGMWLPETAVDIESLEIMTEKGIKFTVLAPHQASKVKPIGGKTWQDVNFSKIDPTMPYEYHLPSGRKIVIFFYDGPISRAVAFEGLLGNGEFFARRLMGAFSDKRNWNQLVHIATDGETYGHHHKHGEMALSYAIHHIENNNLAKITNYGEFIEKFPPTFEVDILENTSWSCAHGIERWRSGCGCNSGMHHGWQQDWRAPLREALDWLRDRLIPQFEEKGRTLLRDPWAARNDYIGVVLDRTPENVEQFFNEHAVKPFNDHEKIVCLKLLEMQRHAMYMYASCGWFFDELSGIETVQVIQFAGRALQLAKELFGDHIEKEFVGRLEKAKSNIPENKDGKTIYDKFVHPAMVDLTKVGAHFAINSLFQEFNEGAMTYSYLVENEGFETLEAGKSKLAVGKIRVTSEITRESALLGFSVLHMGDHNLTGGVRPFQSEFEYQNMVKDVKDTFSKADFPESIRSIDRHFGNATHSLKTLFRDEQRNILNLILETTLTGAESVYREVYENNAPLMHFLVDLMVPMPKALKTAAEFVINNNLRQLFEMDVLDLERTQGLLAEAKKSHITLDSTGLGFTLQKTLERLMGYLSENPSDIHLLRDVVSASQLLTSLPFEVNLWKIQNDFYLMMRDYYPEMRDKAKGKDNTAQAWMDSFVLLGKILAVRMP